MVSDEDYLKAKEIVDKYEKSKIEENKNSDKKLFENDLFNTRCWRGKDYCDCKTIKECMYNDNYIG